MAIRQKQKNEVNYAVVVFCVAIPILIGYLSHDLVIGSTLLVTSLLTSYLTGVGKRIGYFFGILNAFLIAYVAFKNNLFGSAIVNIFIIAPLLTYGFFAWGRNLDQNKNVKIKKLPMSRSIILTASCIAACLLSGFLLTLIPGQQLAYMDATVNCLDLGAMILLDLRYKENWVLWILSAILSVIVWTITLMGGGESALMRLLAAVSYLMFSVYGAIRWYKRSKTER